MNVLQRCIVIAVLFPLCASSGEKPLTGKEHFYKAKEKLEDMLTGKAPASFEEAIYQIENAWWEGRIDSSAFHSALDVHTRRIGNIARLHENRDIGQSSRSEVPEPAEVRQERLKKAVTNYAIYTYLCDTTRWWNGAFAMEHLPYTYASQDPMGTADWANTQVVHLLNEGNGNCFALASLFKIFSDRLRSGAMLCTAPGHIYIRHADPAGIFYNVELSTQSFPGTGTLETLTYTSEEAARNGISLRELDTKQSIVLCLVYLAKGYARKYNIKEDAFMQACANAALQFDDHNLNAMLLKAELLEDRLIAQKKDIELLQKQTDFRDYQQWIAHLFDLGYLEMPFAMKNLIIKGWTRDTLVQLEATDHTPKRTNNPHIKPTRRASLSWGLFDEEIRAKPLERIGNTVFDTKARKVVGFVQADILYNCYTFDPVVFAWSVDPLAHKFPHQSPYAAFDNSPIWKNDPTGAAASPSTDVTDNGDGTYKVVGGNTEDHDRNIYVVDDKGKRTGEVIGQSLTTQSFYYSEKGLWLGTIDPNDKSGVKFLNNQIIGNRPSLSQYMLNAYGGKKYDFKREGTIESDPEYNSADLHYRGMSFNGVQGYALNQKTFASARDVGNFAAGYIAASNLLPWQVARVGFDGLEKWQRGRISATEGSSTQMSEYAGWAFGRTVFRLTYANELARIRQAAAQGKIPIQPK